MTSVNETLCPAQGSDPKKEGKKKKKNKKAKKKVQRKFFHYMGMALFFFEGAGLFGEMCATSVQRRSKRESTCTSSPPHVHAQTCFAMP